MERTGLVWIFSASLAAYFLCNPEIGMVKEVEAIDVDIYMYMYMYMYIYMYMYMYVYIYVPWLC